MKISCEVIKDLLPLYADNVCSESSRAMVEEHICSCGKCKEMLLEFESDEIGNTLKTETKSVIESMAKKQNERSFVIGSVISGIYMIPVIICLIVNLFSSHSLDWFFIVLTSLLLGASLTVLPIMIPKNKFLWTVLGSTVSLFALLLTCAVYTGGKWLFVAESAILFGLSLIILPIVLNVNPVREKFKGYKTLTVLTVSTILYALMMVAIKLFTLEKYFLIFSFAFSALPVLLAWLATLMFRYLRISTVSKFGILAILMDLFIVFYEPSVCLILGIRDFAFTNDNAVVNIIFLSLAAVGIIMIALGGILKRRRKI